MRYARERIEADAVLARVAFEQAPCLLAQPDDAIEVGRERLHGLPRRLSNCPDFGIALRIRRFAAALDFVEPVMQGIDQQAAALRVVDQVVLQIRDCAARPRCRPALRTAFAPSGRYAAPYAARPGSAIRARPAGESRFRGPKTRCSCKESRAGERAASGTGMRSASTGSSGRDRFSKDGRSVATGEWAEQDCKGIGRPSADACSRGPRGASGLRGTADCIAARPLSGHSLSTSLQALPTKSTVFLYCP